MFFNQKHGLKIVKRLFRMADFMTMECKDVRLAQQDR